MNVANNWKDYKIIDMANGQKLEKWGNIILSRPDPQIVWKNKSFPEEWTKSHAIYSRSKTGGGSWEYKKSIPKNWQIKYKDLTFNIKPMGFKHTGLFPEQADISVRRLCRSGSRMHHKVQDHKRAGKPEPVHPSAAYPSYEGRA